MTGCGMVVQHSQAADARVQQELARLRQPAQHQAVANFAERLDDLLQLVEAHQARAGRGVGRRDRTAALNRAALVVLTGHFQGFAEDLFKEEWVLQGRTSDPEKLIRRLRFQNPKPDDIDFLFEVAGCDDITVRAEGRTWASSAGPAQGLVEPVFARERSQHQVRQIVAEMVALRNAVRLSDVTYYLIEVVYLARRMSATLAAVRPT